MPKKVLKIQNHFHSIDGNKDEGNGISERLLLGPKILGQNQSWGKALTFHEDNNDLGQEFDVSGFDLTNDQLSQVEYAWEMDDADDFWGVLFDIQVLLDDNVWYQAFAEPTFDGKPQVREIGDGNPYTGKITLTVVG